MIGVFGVPTMVFNGELFWGGDRIEMLIERIKNPDFDFDGAGRPAPEMKASTAISSAWRAYLAIRCVQQPVRSRTGFSAV